MKLFPKIAFCGQCGVMPVADSPYILHTIALQVHTLLFAFSAVIMFYL